MAGEGFKALSDPTRRRILELLRERDMTAGELAEQTVDQPPSDHVENRGTGNRRTARAEHHLQSQHHGDAGSDRMVHGIHGRRWKRQSSE